MIITPFQAADYLEAHAAIHTGPDFVDREATARHYATGPGYTARLDGQILACAGITIHWPGMGTAWALITPLGCRHPLRVHRAVKQGLASIVDGCHLRRVQAEVMAECAPAIRWVEALGFHAEHLMPRFGPSGESAWRYAYLP